MARIVGKLCAVLPPDAALAAAVAYDEACCRPPLGRSRVKRMVADFAARPSGVWTPVDLEPVLSGELVSERPSILQRTDGQALFYRGRVHVLAGEP
jgi:hypothetical protein